jgi:hypothetical protein
MADSNRNRVVIPFLAVVVVIIIALAAVIGLVSSGSSPEPPLPGYQLHEPRINRALAIADQFWAQRHHSLHCARPIRVVTVHHQSEMAGTESQQFLGYISRSNCEIEYSLEAYKALSWPEFCLLAVKQYGQLLGYSQVRSPRSSIMYEYLTTATYQLPACSNPVESQLYAPPIDTPARSCIFRVDERLFNFTLGAAVGGCQRVQVVGTGHTAIARAQPGHCQEVAHMQPPPEGQQYEPGKPYSYRLLNPERCVQVTIDMVAHGSPHVDGRWQVIGSQSTYYERPSLYSP